MDQFSVDCPKVIPTILVLLSIYVTQLALKSTANLSSNQKQNQNQSSLARTRFSCPSRQRQVLWLLRVFIGLFDCLCPLWLVRVILLWHVIQLTSQYCKIHPTKMMIRKCGLAVFTTFKYKEITWCYPHVLSRASQVVLATTYKIQRLKLRLSSGIRTIVHMMMWALLDIIT